MLWGVGDWRFSFKIFFLQKVCFWNSSTILLFKIDLHTSNYNNFSINVQLKTYKKIQFFDWSEFCRKWILYFQIFIIITLKPCRPGDLQSSIGNNCVASIFNDKYCLINIYSCFYKICTTFHLLKIFWYWWREIFVLYDWWIFKTFDLNHLSHQVTMDLQYSSKTGTKA